MCCPCVRSSRRGVKLNSGSVKKRRGNGGRKSAGSRRNRRGERRRSFTDENRWAHGHTGLWLLHSYMFMMCNMFVFYSSAVSSRNWSWSFCSRASSSRACQGAQDGVEARQELCLWAKLPERAWDSWSWRQRDFTNSSSRELSSSKG